MYCDIFCWIQTAFQTIKFFHKLQAHQHAESTTGANCSSDLAWNQAARRCLRLSSSSGAEGPPAPTAQLHGEQPHGAPGSPQNTPPWSSLWLRKLQQLLSYLRAFFSGSVSTDSGLLICGTSILNIMGCVIDLAIADALQA